MALAITTESKECIQQSVIIVSNGRSGSTLLMSSLSRFPTAFDLSEPFGPWGKDYVTKGVQVFWPFSCHSSEAIKINPDILNRCKQQKMLDEDFEFLFSICAKSCIRVIKTLRHHLYPLDLQQVKSIERMSSLQVIHLVRRPWDIVVSKYIHGWDFNSTLDSLSQALQKEC
eukprot:gene2294-8047_t